MEGQAGLPEGCRPIAASSAWGQRRESQTVVEYKDSQAELPLLLHFPVKWSQYFLELM